MLVLRDFWMSVCIEITLITNGITALKIQPEIRKKKKINALRTSIKMKEQKGDIQKHYFPHAIRRMVRPSVVKIQNPQLDNCIFIFGVCYLYDIPDSQWLFIFIYSAQN